MLDRRLPILGWLPGYERAWLRSDVIAGLTVVALLIPEGMAYAQIAGMPPETAFYAAPIGLLMFAVFSTSRQLIVAVSAAIATMSFATVSQIAKPNTTDFIVLTAALAVLSGLIAVVAGILKMGRIAQFFSESVMVGFISGLALVIAIKQMPKVLGIEGSAGNFWERSWHLIRHVSETHGLTLAIGIGCVALLVALERLVPRLPAALIALVIGIIVSAAFGLAERGVEIVGDIPSGLAAPRWPSITWHQWGMLLPGAFGIALVSFAEALGPARAFASKHHHPIDPNQELVGLGASNIGAGFFQGFPIGSSLSKSAANDRAGAQTQMSSIIAAATTALVAVSLTGLFHDLPEAVLGAIVIVAISGMVKVSKMIQLSRVRTADFVLAVVAFLAALTFETLQALLIAVLVSLFALVVRASQPRLAILGRVPNGTEFTDTERHPENETVPGMMIVRPENGLFFANAVAFREAIVARAHASEAPIRTLLIDLEATTDLDVPSADMLSDLHSELSGLGIRMTLTRVITPVREFLDRTGTLDEIGRQNVFLGPIDAVNAHLATESP